VAGHRKVAADALEDSCDGLAATDPNIGGCIRARVVDYPFSSAGAHDAPTSRPGRCCGRNRQHDDGRLWHQYGHRGDQDGFAWAVNGSGGGSLSNDVVLQGIAIGLPGVGVATSQPQPEMSAFGGRGSGRRPRPGAGRGGNPTGLGDGPGRSLIVCLCNVETDLIDRCLGDE
jgi:hypothetical protein